MEIGMWNNTPVVVAGSSGLVGINLVTKLRQMGCKVRSIFHTKPPPISYDDVEYVQADLRIGDNCKKVVKDMEYAFHVAASTSGAAAISSTPMIHVTPNLLIDSQFLDACYQEKIKKVLWTGSTTGYPESGDTVIEESQMFKGDPYPKYYMTGWTKRFSEILCNMYSHKLAIKMPVVVLRPTNIYGPYDKFDFERCHVIPALIRKVVERQDPIEVWGDGEDVRDFIYIDDMIDAIVLAMEKMGGYDPINIGLGKCYTVKEVLNTIIKLDGYTNAKIVYNTARPTMIPKRRVSIKKSEQLLGFKPKTELEEGIKKTIEFYRQHTCE